jgi:hypothetical protein
LCQLELCGRALQQLDGVLVLGAAAGEQGEALELFVGFVNIIPALGCIVTHRWAARSPAAPPVWFI